VTAEDFFQKLKAQTLLPNTRFFGTGDVRRGTMTISHNLTPMQIDAKAVRDIIEAASAVDLARQGPSHELFKQAQSHLRLVVQRANHQGLSWQSIGDALGIARGNAYQRYRRRPEPRTRARAYPSGQMSANRNPSMTASTAQAITPPGP
jgi:hypothetical protein